jgi:hypothetical protein
MGKLGIPMRRSQPAWWVTGRKKDGKMCLLGPFMEGEGLGESQADDIMMEAFPNDTGRKHYLRTSSRQAATSQLKFILFSETNDLDGSMQRISHIK